MFLHLLLIFHLTELFPGPNKVFKCSVEFAVLRSVSKVYLQGKDIIITIHHLKIPFIDFWTQFFPTPFQLSGFSFRWPSSTCSPSSLLSAMPSNLPTSQMLFPLPYTFFLFKSCTFSKGSFRLKEKAGSCVQSYPQ